VRRGLPRQTRAMAHSSASGSFIHFRSRRWWRHSRRAKSLFIGVQVRVVRIIRVEVGENARREAPCFRGHFLSCRLSMGGV